MKLFRIWLPIVALAGLFLVSFAPEQPQVVPDEIYTALKTGNAKQLSKYFNSSVEVIILDKEGVYSKTQAEYIVKDFFSKNAPNNYTKLHEVKKDASKAVIGKLTTARSVFRVYFLMINVNGVFTIQQLRIENDNN